ncbi:hypothetical protein C2857_003926 [Epichloe festucae Fl1]|uniref:Uncharacterized protein n=1 Tax=Epichloe festucae (strain Fl1) TaxID=877507 RepID=A0A7S9KKL3_EPIFF|nr:hypothetical protein C2857_003926 [Epichloe festucae Fl1]
MAPRSNTHHHLHARDDTSPGVVALYIILGAIIALVFTCILHWGCFEHHVYSFRRRRRTPSSSIFTTGFRHGTRHGHRRRDASPVAVPLDTLDPETGDVTRPNNIHLRQTV